jgi:hypothetical protein
MPIAIKRRKLATASNNAASFVNKSGGIAAFTKVSKSNTVISTKVTEKIEAFGTFSVKQVKQETLVAVGGKRKAIEIEEEDEQEISQVPSFGGKNNEPTSLLRSEQLKSQVTPRTPRKPILNSKVNTVDTPTKGARGLLDRLLLTSKTPTRSSSNPSIAPISLLDTNTPPFSQEKTTTLPTELLDVINLQAAFLTALSLHYAHNGTNSPADLRMLCPNVARAWGKRRVTMEDVQRTLGVLNSSISRKRSDNRIAHLTLSDYGQGKICIEICITGGKDGIVARPVNENLMNEIFVQELKKLWEEKSTTEIEPKQFISTLPMESITTCSSVLKGAAVIAKGQRRLEEFKVGISIKKEEEKVKAQEAETAYRTGVKPTLLERLRAKQLEKINAPPPPTKEELTRKGAMQKIEEVAAVLSILSTSSSVGQQRVSFTLPTILGKLRDSLNTPISKAEAEACIRLLAAEIAPMWVKLVKLGKVEALVVNREERPTEANILERIKQTA